ncbi:MAG TPA: glycosyltransferase family 39 protein [Chthoniobacterales bacterium]
MSSTESLPGPTRVQFFYLFAAALLFHIAGSWSLPLIDRDEPRFAEASREMLERQDFVVPYFNNEYRFDKPPLTYWLQSSAYRVFGQNEFAARLPSAFAAAGVAVILLVWGRRMFDTAAGWRAAIIFTLSLQVVMHAKAAVADMLMVFFVTLAAWAGWEMTRDPAKRAPLSVWWWTFFLALGFGFLAKGPVAWIVIVPVAVYISLAGGKKSWIWFAVGILVALAVTAAWGIPALIRTDGEFLKVGIGKHVVGRSLATMEGHGAKGLLGYVATLPMYFVTIFLSFAPWSIRLPELIGGWRDLWKKHETGFLLWNVVLVFGVFTVVKTKLPHYTLPAIPMLALVVAHQWPVAGAARFRKLAMGMAAFILILALIVFPLVRSQFPAQHLARMSRDVLKPAMEFASYEFQEPSLVWYFREYVHGFYRKVDPRKAAKFMRKDGPRFYILPTSEIDNAFPGKGVNPNWKVFRHQGWNVAKGQKIDLTMIVKTED